MIMFNNNEVPVLENIDQILTDLHAHEIYAPQEINWYQKKKKSLEGLEGLHRENFQCVSMCCYQQKKLSCVCACVCMYVCVCVQHRGTLWFKKKKNNNSLATPHPPHPLTPPLSAQR